MAEATAASMGMEKPNRWLDCLRPCRTFQAPPSLGIGAHVFVAIRDGETICSIVPETHSLGLEVPVLPRRGPPVAAIRAPRWHLPEEGEKRQHRWFEPRGTLGGGPERSVKEPQTQFPKTSQSKSNRERGVGGSKTTKRPMIVTVQEGGRTRTWGPLSRTTSWRVGCFREEMQGAAKVFIKKDERMTEVEAEKPIEGGREVLVRGEKMTSLNNKKKSKSPPRESRKSPS